MEADELRLARQPVFDSHFQGTKIVAKHSPHDVDIDPEILMDECVPHSNDLFSGH